MLSVTGEAELDERRWDAFWSWREHPPTKEVGKTRQVIPFERFWDTIIGKPMEIVLPDEEKIARIMAAAKKE